MKKAINILAFSLLLSGCGSLRLIPQSATAPKTVLTPEQAAAQTALWRRHFTDPALRRLVEATIANNNDLRIAFQRVQAARAQVTAARGTLAPVISAVAGGGVTKFGNYTMDGAGNNGTPIFRDQTIPRNLPDFNVGLQAAWELDVWGKLRSQKKAAAERVLATEEGQRLVLVNLITDVATHYYDLVALDSTLHILDDTLRIQNDALSAVQAQKEAGITNTLAVEQFQARLQNLRGMRIEAREQILQSEAAIRLLLGDSRRSITRTSTPITQLRAPGLSRSVPASLLVRRPDVLQAEHELTAARADVKAARAAFLPQVNINGELGLQAFRSDLLLNSHSTAYSLAGGLVAPLINRAAIKAEFQKAGAAELEALAAYQQSIVTAYVEVHNQQARIRLLDDLHQVKRRQVALLTQSVATSDDLFATRRATYLEVLNAQQTALEGRLELVDVKKRQFQLQLSLYKALGGG